MHAECKLAEEAAVPAANVGPAADNDIEHEPAAVLKPDDGPLQARVRDWLHAADPRGWQPVSGWPLLLTYFLLTFAQALPGTAVGLMLANELHFGSDQVYQFRSATFVPWTIRPVYAFVSDQVPLGSYRRRPYFALCAVLACAAQVCMALFGVSKHNFLVLAVATQVFLAFCEVVCDSLSVEWGNELAIRVAAQQIKAHQREADSGPVKETAKETEEAHSPKEFVQEWSTPLLLPSSMASDGASSSSASFFPERAPFVSEPQVRLRSVVVAPCSPHSDAEGNGSLLQNGQGAPASRARNARQSSKQDAYAARVVSRLLASTPDISTLTPLLLKSRIQSECMTIRCAGSVGASALSTWVMLVYFSPRNMLLWSSSAFLLGLGSMAFYKMERKVGRGFFGLSLVGAGTMTPLTPTEPPSVEEGLPPSAVPSMQPPGVLIPSSTPYSSPLIDATPFLDSPGATEHMTPTATELPALATASLLDQRGCAPVGLSDAPRSHSPLLSSSSSSSLGEIEQGLCGLSSARCVFIWHKFLTLLRAIRLLLGPLLFIFLVNLMPTSDDAYYNYMYTQYDSEISDSGFSRINFLGLTGSLLGCMGYQRWVASRPRTNLKRVFLVTTVTGSIVGCAQLVLAMGAHRSLGLSAEQWMLLSGFLVSGVQMLSQLPALILASYYAPKDLGLEASMFSLFAATAHVASLAEAQLTAVLVQRLGMAGTDYSNLWKLIAIANSCALLPLLLMPVLLHPRVTGRNEQEEEEGPAKPITSPTQTQTQTAQARSEREASG